MRPLGEAAGVAGAAGAAGAEAGLALGDRLGVLLPLPLPLPPVVVVVAVVVVVLPLSLLRSSLRRVAVKGDGNWLGLGTLKGLLGEGLGLLGLLATPTPAGVEVRMGDKMEGEPKPAGLNWTGLYANGSRLMSDCVKAA